MRTGYLVLVVGILLGLWLSTTPTPKPVNAAPESFSATRAFADIKIIGAKPHPIGSAEHDKVQAYLVRRLAAMGLQPQIQSERITQDDVGRTVSAPVSNVIGILKGADSSKPAVLVMAHYDTVPDSPGAADDTAGVATLLEIARALKAGAKPPRDVVFLFTDGEEPGLMGAGAFFRDNPLLRHIGAMVNFDVRGDAGRSFMFETGPKNADAVALWRAKTPNPSGNSLATAIYKRMPNGTDFTLGVERGLPGLNFAFLGDEEAYHTALATPAHLNLGSVQHMGGQGLAAVRAFAWRIPAQTADSVYSDVLGLFVIQYSIAFGWILLAVTALCVLVAIFTAQRESSFAWGRGLVGALAALVLPAVALWLVGQWFGGTYHFLRLAHFDFLLAGAALLALGAALFGANLYPPVRHAAVWPWLLLFLLVLAAVLQVHLAEGAFAIVWPLLATALIGMIRFTVYRGKDSAVATVLSLLIGVVVVAQSVMLGTIFFTSLGVSVPLVLMLPLITVLPLLLLMPGQPLPRAVHLVVLFAGVALFAYGRYAPATAERPHPSTIRYVMDQDHGKAYRVDYLDSGDAWTKSALGADFHFAPLPFTHSVPYSWAPAKPVPVPNAALTIRREGDALIVSAKPGVGAWVSTLSVRAPVGLAASSLDGTPLAASAPADWHDMRVHMPGADGFTWIVPVPKFGPLELRLVMLYPWWPRDAAKLPPLPADKMRFNNTETTEVVLQRVWNP